MAFKFAHQNPPAGTLEALEQLLAKAPSTVAKSEWDKMSLIEKVKWCVNATVPPQYPLLQTLLNLRGLSLQPPFSYEDAEKILGLSTRTLQQRVRKGKLTVRDLGVHGRFLPQDLEEFLRTAKKSPKGCKKSAEEE